MKNSYKKGRKAELERVKELESQGYKCISAPKGNRFSKQKDFFDHWDIVAYYSKHKVYPGHWLVEQVKSNTTGGVLKKLKEAAKELPSLTEARLVIRVDGCGGKKATWRVINLR